jgi:predicted dehydrogenase
MQSLRIGFVGTTSPHSFMFLDTLRLMTDAVQYIVLVETDYARIEKAGLDRVYSGVEDMISLEHPDVAFIMTGTDEAEEPAMRCIEAGIPIILDKHCARSSESLRRIVSAAEARGVKMATGYMWRYLPVARQLRAWVAAGMLGRPYCFDARMVTTSAEVRLDDPQFAWLFDKARSGGGILLWLGCHYIDLIRFVLQREIVAVSAMTSRLTTAATDVEDVASVSFQLHDGIVGTLHCAYVMPKGFKQLYDTSFAVYGSDGDATWSPVIGMNPTLRVRSLHGEWARCPERTIQYEEIPEPKAYCGTRLAVHFFRDMLESLTTGKDFITVGADAVKVLEICEAAYRSAETGQRIELPHPSAEPPAPPLG